MQQLIWLLSFWRVDSQLSWSDSIRSESGGSPASVLCPSPPAGIHQNQNAANRKTRNVIERKRIDWRERPFRRGNFPFMRLFSSCKKIVTQSSLRGPKSLSVDVVSPGGQTVKCVCGGGSTLYGTWCGLLSGQRGDRSRSIGPWRKSAPFDQPRFRCSGGVERVLRVLSERDLFKLLGLLQEQGSAPVPLPPISGVLEEAGCSTSPQTFSVPFAGNTIRLDTTPPPGFQPRLITCQESTSGFSPAGVTGSAAISGLPPAGGAGYEGVVRGPLPAPPLLFAKGRETGSHP
jgi:hypothetical protein